MGKATVERLQRDGHRTIGIDVQTGDGVDVVADMGTAEGRATALEEVGARADGRLEGVVTFAGIAGRPGQPGSRVVSINHFGSVAMLEGLRPLLAAGAEPAAVAISSNSTTTLPGISRELIAACLSGDEAAARALADEVGAVTAYPSSKTALAWWVRRHAVTPEWAGAGINLNALAPGATDTAMYASAMADPEMGPLLAEFTLPIGRIVRADEMAAVVAFLLGPDGRCFCGSVVFADGGTDATRRPDDWPSPIPPR
jgi:NAD(P)-dependent dehydrogenase (short-subunit alcohol dehydrogenase family)